MQKIINNKNRISEMGECSRKMAEILKYFGGIQGVLKASVEELSRVPMINENLAEKIYKHLQNQ